MAHLEVGVLSSGHLMVEDTRVGRSDVGLEALVELSDLGPVLVETLNVLVRDSGTEVGLLERGADGTHGGLGRQSREDVDGNVDNVGSGGGAGNHARGGDTGRVVRVDVNRQVGVVLSDGRNERRRGSRLEETGHVLDGEDVDALLDELVDEVEVVLERVFGLLGVGQVTRVADGSLDDSAGLLGSVDTELHVLDKVERVEDSEDVETGLDRPLAELVDGVVRVRRVTDGVGSSDERLERNVGDELSEGSESVPRVLVQEPHGNVKGGTSPALERVGVLEGVRRLLGNVGHVDGSQSGGEQRLVGVSPGGVHDQLQASRGRVKGQSIRSQTRWKGLNARNQGRLGRPLRKPRVPR